MDPVQVFVAIIMVTGLALVLYTSPIKYTELQKAILLAGGSVFLLLATWHAGVRITFIVLAEYIAPGELEEARRRATGLQMPPSYQLIGVAFFGSYWFVLQINRAIERTKQLKRKKGSSV